MNKLVFDQDTQKGYVVSPFDEILPNIERVLVAAMRNDTLVASTTFFDPIIDYEKLSETIIVTDELYYNVPITRHGIDMNVSDSCYQVNFEKLGNNIWDENTGQPDNFMTYLRTNNINTVYIIGNMYEGNIIDTYEGLSKSKYNVVIVEDAIINFTDHSRDRLMLLNRTNNNLRILTIDEAIGEFSE